MINFLRPVASTALRNPTSSQELIWVRSISTLSDRTSLSAGSVCPWPASAFTVDRTIGNP